MIAFIIILVISIAYAVIRAFHDSKISGGKWKTWAFIEGILVDLAIVALLWRLFYVPDWWMMFPAGFIFAFVFWLVFDCMEGYLRTGNILYIGSSGFDQKMREMFHYNKPLFGWKETGSIRLIFFKSFWLVLLIGAYFALL